MKYTKSQEQAFIKFVDFINSPDKNIFILKGYAGTGKTTLIRGFIDYLQKQNKAYCLLASTGRAAKVLKNITKKDARTIHSQIYKFDDLNENIGSIAKIIEVNQDDENRYLFPKFELCADKNNTGIFIIDESSMISDEEEKNPEIAIFGSGKLLTDLMDFAPRAKFIFVGDDCQLPPVKQETSPALDKEYLKTMFETVVVDADLIEVVRQQTDNDITLASEKIRNMVFSPSSGKKWHKFPLKKYKNIRVLPNQITMLEDYIKAIQSKGYNYATCICRSNKTAAQLTSFIRPKLGFIHDRIQKNDLLLVTQNNLISGLLNGDLIRVIDVGEKIRKAKLTFIRVQVEELASKHRYSQYLVEELLFQNVPHLTRAQQRTLYIDYYNRMKAKGIYQSSKEFREGMFKDEFLNAIRAVFGYVITCHKAQGGEWNSVYLDIPKNLGYQSSKADYQWLYTAITRAKEHLYIHDGFWLE